MVRLHVDVGYCTGYHSRSLNYSCLTAVAIVLVKPKFADAPCTKVTLASDDCSFELEIAFVVGPDWI